MFKKRGSPETGFIARHKILIGVGTLLGAIVGAGILAIPYVMAQSGLLLGFILIVGLGLSLLLVNLMAGEIVLRTNKQHQLTGYAERYLGPWGKRLMMFSMVFSIYGALTAYLIGLGETVRAIVHWGNPLMYTIICFVIAFSIIYRGVKATGTVDFILMGLVILIIFSITVISYNNINLEHLTTINIAKFFVPYGVILFALMGIPAVPEVQEVLGQQKEKMKKILIIGSLIPIVLYILFAGVVVGIIGLDNFQILEPNQRIATVALSIYSSPILGIFANLIAVLAMFTSFLTLGTALIEMYEYDYLFPRSYALLLTFTIPLLIALFSLSTFISVIALTGAIAGGLQVILIIFTFWKARNGGERTPEYSLKAYKILGSLLILLFGVGVVLELLSVL
ncbi:MAG: aromatic amino acid transport family protein [Nanoarchaeota archaeon]|nr:aromatic amino acid transport family protein [Nanoarchaeota archaeon]